MLALFRMVCAILEQFDWDPTPAEAKQLLALLEDPMNEFGSEDDR